MLPIMKRFLDDTPSMALIFPSRVQPKGSEGESHEPALLKWPLSSLGF